MEPPHIAKDPMSATPASIQRNLTAMLDSELARFESTFQGLMQMPNLTLSSKKRSQAVLIAA